MYKSTYDRNYRNYVKNTSKKTTKPKKFKHRSNSMLHNVTSYVKEMDKASGHLLFTTAAILSSWYGKQVFEHLYDEYYPNSSKNKFRKGISLWKSIIDDCLEKKCDNPDKINYAVSHMRSKMMYREKDFEEEDKDPKYVKYYECKHHKLKTIYDEKVENEYDQKFIGNLRPQMSGGYGGYGGYGGFGSGYSGYFGKYDSYYDFGSRKQKRKSRRRTPRRTPRRTRRTRRRIPRRSRRTSRRKHKE